MNFKGMPPDPVSCFRVNGGAGLWSITPLGLDIEGALPPIWDCTGFFHCLLAMTEPFFEIRDAARGVGDLAQTVADQVVEVQEPLPVDRGQRGAVVVHHTFVFTEFVSTSSIYPGFRVVGPSFRAVIQGSP